MAGALTEEDVAAVGAEATLITDDAGVVGVVLGSENSPTVEPSVSDPSCAGSVGPRAVGLKGSNAAGHSLSKLSLTCQVKQKWRARGGIGLRTARGCEGTELGADFAR